MESLFFSLSLIHIHTERWSESILGWDLKTWVQMLDYLFESFICDFEEAPPPMLTYKMKLIWSILEEETLQVTKPLSLRNPVQSMDSMPALCYTDLSRTLRWLIWWMTQSRWPWGVVGVCSLNKHSLVSSMCQAQWGTKGQRLPVWRDRKYMCKVVIRAWRRTKQSKGVVIGSNWD